MQDKVGNDADDNHEYYRVLQDLKNYNSHDPEFALLVVSLILPLLDLAEAKANRIQKHQGHRCNQVDVHKVLWVCALVQGFNCGERRSSSTLTKHTWHISLAVKSSRPNT